MHMLHLVHANNQHIKPSDHHNSKANLKKLLSLFTYQNFTVLLMKNINNSFWFEMERGGKYPTEFSVQ